MTTLAITWTWKVTSSLHIGTGLSRPGHADRLIRIENGSPVLPGDAVKGALRGCAEQLLRWLDPDAPKELDERSFPRHPVLRNLFAPREREVLYRFPPAVFCGPAGSPFLLSSTAIERKNGVALQDTLRVVEAWQRGAEFEVAVEGYGGNWSDSSSDDRSHLTFLLAAILSTDRIGGHKGAGFGQLDCSKLTTNIPGLAVEDMAAMLTESKIADLRKWTQKQRNSQCKPGN